MGKLTVVVVTETVAAVSVTSTVDAVFETVEVEVVAVTIQEQRLLTSEDARFFNGGGQGGVFAVPRLSRLVGLSSTLTPLRAPRSIMRAGVKEH